MEGDVLGLLGEEQEGEPLLVPVMRGGRRLPGATLAAARKRAAAQLARLPEALRGLSPAPPYAVTVSAALQELAAGVDAGSG